MTVMYMDEGLDTGDILLQTQDRHLAIRTGATLHDRLAQIAPEALLESLRLLAAGNAPRIPQDQALATYAPKLNREAGRLNWNEASRLSSERFALIIRGRARSLSSPVAI